MSNPYGPHDREVKEYIRWAKDLTPTSAFPLSQYRFDQVGLDRLRAEVFARLQSVDQARANDANRAGWDAALEAFEAADFADRLDSSEVSIIRAFVFAVSAEELLTNEEKYKLQYHFRAALGQSQAAENETDA